MTNLKAFLLPGKVVRNSLGLSAKLYSTARWQCCKLRTNPRHMDRECTFKKTDKVPIIFFQAPHEGQKYHFSPLPSATTIRKANN